MIISGFLPFFERVSFIIISFALRILQGALTAIMNPMYYQFGALLYPDSKDTVYAWLYIAAIAGFGLGPAVGGTIYKFLGFDIAQYFVAIFGLLIFFPMAVFGIPKSVDKQPMKQQDRDP